MAVTSISGSFVHDVVIKDGKEPNTEDWSQSSTSFTFGSHTITLQPDGDTGQFILTGVMTPPRRVGSWIIGVEAFLEEVRHLVRTMCDQAIATEILSAKAELAEERRLKQEKAAEDAAAHQARHDAEMAERQSILDQANQNPE